MSYVLRHDPASIGITLDPGGWVDVGELLAGLSAAGSRVTRDQLDDVVRTGDKQRFVVDGDRIRAAHGHSVAVDLGYSPQAPPDVLWHGTSVAAVEAIRREGLRPRSRQLVHLSTDVATARSVGARHGPATVLRIDAAAMAADRHVFYRSTSGIWLTLHVPPAYIACATVDP
jgi:putative RNA 2'-phosphotransferase